MRSSLPRNCARRDLRQGVCAGAIAVTHSARAPREIPRKRKLQCMHVHDFVNARICSLHREFGFQLLLAQEISARSTESEMQSNPWLGDLSDEAGTDQPSP